MVNTSAQDYTQAALCNTAPVAVAAAAVYASAAKSACMSASAADTADSTTYAAQVLHSHVPQEKNPVSAP